MKKNIFIPLYCLVFTVFFLTIPNAEAACIEQSDSTYYYETIITIIDPVPSSISFYNTTRTITGTKTTNAHTADGSIAWSVSVTGTFSYDGTTAKCISCSHSAKSYSQTWRIKSVTSSRKSNSATATAIATHNYGSISSRDVSQSVTIVCNKNGTIS